MAARTSAWLPAGNRTSDRAAVTDSRPRRRSSRASSASFSIFRQPPADPALVPAQQVGDLQLGQAVFADQGVDDPGFFPVAWPPASAVEAVQGGLGRPLVGIEEANAQGRQAEDARLRQAFEAVENLRRLLAEAGHQEGQLPVATQRLRHGGFGRGSGSR
jgi:hypothetical protein